MLRRPHKQTFPWLPIWTVLQFSHGDRIGLLRAGAPDPYLTLTACRSFFFPLSRPFPVTTGGRARTQRRLLCSVSAKGTMCVTSITPRGRRCTQTLAALVVKLQIDVDRYTEFRRQSWTTRSATPPNVKSHYSRSPAAHLIKLCCHFRRGKSHLVFHFSPGCWSVLLLVLTKRLKHNFSTAAIKKSEKCTGTDIPTSLMCNYHKSTN